MQNTETSQFFAYVETNSRPDAQAKRRLLARPLIEGKYSSINLLVRSIDGNSRDKAWVSQAIKDGAIKRGPIGELVLPDVSAQEPEVSSEVEVGSLEWLLDQVWACDSRVSVAYMTEVITNAWERAEGARAAGKHYTEEGWT